MASAGGRIRTLIASRSAMRWLSLGMIATWFATAPPAIAADIAFGEYLSGECSGCHRKDGQEKGIPAIIGWSADQFVAVMNAYKTKDRPNPVMQTIAGKFSDQELEALAAYYASLKPQP